LLTYRQQPPPAHLAAWVECTWTLEGVAPATTETILPDGRMELVVHHASRPENQAGQFVTGQLTTAVHIRPTGPMSTSGVRLRPAAAGAFLRMPANELTGQFVSLNIQPPVHLPDAAITRAITLIEQAAGAARMDRLTHDVNLSPRQLDRRFLAAVGLPPKAFARIVRFQAVLAAYRNSDFTRWADLALQCGFYDQAHLANEFRRFAGAPPTAFFRHPSALALLMANLSKTSPFPKNYHRDQCDF
jgi:AraC-like DNA-binding protein